MDPLSLRMVVGLGNPGKEYDRTRHNTGFMVVDALADTHAISLNKTKYDTDFGRGSIKGTKVILAKPMAFMNRSGIPVQRLAQYYRVSHENLLVVHDDIDLAIGRLKIKEKGGDAGHKGIRSMIEAFGGGDFPRLRVGIGRTETDAPVTDHVLGRFNRKEAELMHRIIVKATDAVITILSSSIVEGMNRFNNTRITI